MKIRNAIVALSLGLASSMAMAATTNPAPAAPSSSKPTLAAKHCKKGYTLVKNKCEKAKPAAQG